MNKKITVFGLGYVGASLSVLLSKNNTVTAIDINEERVNLINNKISPIKDDLIYNHLRSKDLDLNATTNQKAFVGSDYIILAVPTNYDEFSNFFDTTILESIIKDIKLVDKDVPIIIKSTVYLGFTDYINDKFNCSNIIFSPEFLREGHSLHDNLNPSRIVIGDNSKIAKAFCKLMIKASNIKEEDFQDKIFYTEPKEAESIKLFSNSYLAMRVSFFNELDTYCYVNNLDTKSIIDGVSADPRIGSNYNNPSFGYGGYCLPKDTKQLLANFGDIPQDIIKAIVHSNKTRLEFLAEEIIKKDPRIVGIYRLAMKNNSDNFRYSAIIEIMKIINKNGISIMIYEPSIDSDEFNGMPIINNLNNFKSSSDIIMANRLADELDDVSDKVFSRDLYQNN